MSLEAIKGTFGFYAPIIIIGIIVVGVILFLKSRRK